MASKIMVVRHGEKPGDPPPPHGVEPTGEKDKDCLIVRGWQRSGALGCLFSNWGAPTRPGLAVPATIYATDPGSKSQRPLQTVSEVAALLNLTVDVDFSDKQEVALAQAAKAAPGPVLIGWHHEEIPAIGNAVMGNDTTCPQTWPGDRFDVIWLFDLVGSVWTFTQVPQMLLAGDLPTPIPMKAKAAA